MFNLTSLSDALGQGMKHPKADAIAPEGRARQTLEAEGDFALGIASNQGAPHEIDIARMAFDRATEIE
jgi:hypothetical protein